MRNFYVGFSIALSHHPPPRVGKIFVRGDVYNIAFYKNLKMINLTVIAKIVINYKISEVV